MSAPSDAPAPAPADQHPLHFLHRAPLVTVLGDPEQRSLPHHLAQLVRLAPAHPLLASFLHAALAALNGQVAQMLEAHGEQPAQAACLTLASLRAPETRAVLASDPLYIPSLELIAVLGSLIAACNPLDSNPVAAGVEPNLLARLGKYGTLTQGLVIDLSAYGLARSVLHASQNRIADVAHYGANAVALAWALATTTDVQAANIGPQLMTSRLVVPTAAAPVVESSRVATDKVRLIPFNHPSVRPSVLP